MEKLQTGEHAKKMLKWLGWADKDYIAARPLLLDGYLLIQGGMFANTAVEKYLKMIFLVEGRNPPHSHRVLSLYTDLAKLGYPVNVNPDYLDLLEKCYKLRYPDDLEPGYSIALE